MTVKRRFLVIIVACWFVIIAGISVPTMCASALETDLGRDSFGALAQVSYTPHAPIVISSDQDFADQGWPGSGSIIDPYIIEELSFDTLLNGSCVRISHTRAWFILRYCLFDHSELSFDGSVSLFNVSRVTVALCVFEQGTASVMAQDCEMMNLELLTCTGGGILCYECSNSTIDKCTIDSTTPEGAGLGILLYTCTMMDLTENTVEYCPQQGVSMYESHDCEIVGNTVQHCDLIEIFVTSDCSYNTFCDNHIVSGGLYACAWDDGQSNAWDAGPGHGNWWSDYSGSGYYYVPGSAGAIDHYPRGPAVTTTTTTTTTTTAINTTEITSVISSGIHIWTPVSGSERIALIALVTASTALIATALFLLLRKAKFV